MPDITDLPPALQRFSLTGRTALVTGSSRGIGWESAKAMAEAGARVILNGRNEETLKARQKELAAANLEAEYLVFDAHDAEASMQAVRDAITDRGGIDILVSNAGAAYRKSLEETSLEGWRGVIESHVTTSFGLAKALAPAMREKGWGRIILTSSIMGQVSRPNNTAYTAAKSSMNGLVRALAAELASDGVTCNAVAPGWVLTAATQELHDDPAWNDFIVKRNPMARWGRPEEIASAVLFLASEAGSFINGHVLTVDGGLVSVL